MPKVLRIVVAILLLASLLSGVLSYILFYVHGHEEFWGALLLHFFAELAVLSAGIWITYIVALKLADEKIKPLVKLVAKLRADKIITGEIARGAVMCAAKVLSEARLKQDISVSITERQDKCDVCDLKINIRSDFRCQHCGLNDHVWKLDRDPMS